MATYTIEVTDNGDVPAVANGGVASIVVTDATAAGGGGGGVTSVNGKVGVVTLSASDVGAATSAQGALADSAVQPGDIGTAATHAATDFETAGAAAAALVTAEAYTDAAVAGIGGGGGGAVASVNGQTGAVVLAASDVGAATTAQGAKADSAVQPGDLATVATTGAYSDLGGKPTLGTAAALDVPATGDAISAQVVKGTDTRLTNARTPTAHKASHATGGSDALAPSDIGAAASSHTHPASQISDSTTVGRSIVTAADPAAVRTAAGLATVAATGAYSDLTGKPTLGTAAAKDIPATGNASATQVVYGSDTRLSDSRTPTAHASSHASAGSDPLTIAESQVTNLTTDLAAKAPLASPALTGNPTAPTQTAGNNSTRLATTAYADAAVAAGPIDATKVTHTIQAQTGTTYTLVLGDAGKFVTMTNASASTLTVPPNSSVAFPVGTCIEGAQLGAGQVTLTAGAGVTINATPGLKVAAQYGTFGLLKTATDTWLAMGRLSA